MAKTVSRLPAKVSKILKPITPLVKKENKKRLVNVVFLVWISTSFSACVMRRFPYGRISTKRPQVAERDSYLITKFMHKIKERSIGSSNREIRRKYMSFHNS